MANWLNDLSTTENIAITTGIATVLATLFASIISSFVSYVINKYNQIFQERASLDNLITQMISFTIQYPYLEDENFCEHWSKNLTDESALRYENYCCLVFNILEKTWKHFNKDDNKINDFIYVNEIVSLHKKWWKSDSNNNYGYDNKFKKYIDDRI